MEVGEVIAFADGLKPNAYTNAEKTAWINELESLIQTDVFRLTETDDHVWEDSFQGTGMMVTDDKTLKVPGRLEVRAGGSVTITGAETIENITKAKVLDATVGDDETVIVFPDETFTVTGTEAESAKAEYDGSGETTLATKTFRRMYCQYLIARIAFANGEYNDYANEAAMFDAIWNQYRAWYCRNYIDTKE